MQTEIKYSSITSNCVTVCTKSCMKMEVKVVVYEELAT